MRKLQENVASLKSPAQPKESRPSIDAMVNCRAELTSLGIAEKGKEVMTERSPCIPRCSLWLGLAVVSATRTQPDCEHCASLAFQLSTHHEVMENTSSLGGELPRFSY